MFRKGFLIDTLGGFFSPFLFVFSFLIACEAIIALIPHAQGFLEELISQVDIPILRIVVDKHCPLGIHASNSPEAVIVLRTQSAHSCSMRRRQNFEMGHLVDLFLDQTMQIHSFHKQKFLR